MRSLHIVCQKPCKINIKNIKKLKSHTIHIKNKRNLPVLFILRRGQGKDGASGCFWGLEKRKKVCYNSFRFYQEAKILEYNKR